LSFTATSGTNPAGWPLLDTVFRSAPPPGEAKDYFSVHNGTDWSLGTSSACEGRSGHDLAIGPDGNAWFTDQASPDRTLRKLDVQTGKVTDWKLLSSGCTRAEPKRDSSQSTIALIRLQCGCRTGVQTKLHVFGSSSQ